MIVDLDLNGKTVIVIGGGNEALKRISSLLKQGCEIIVISDSVIAQVNKLAKAKKIKIKKKKVNDMGFISKLKPNMIITTTDDQILNHEIVSAAKKNKIIAYSSDNPEESDFSNPAIIDFENIIQIAIFTGGRSPAMSKKIRLQTEKIFKNIITKGDIEQIKIQQIARTRAKEKINTQIRRKAFLKNIMSDKEIKQLIEDGKPKKAENRVMTILRDWK